MRFLQLNLNNCQAAQDLLSQTVRELNIDVAILSEPYRRNEQGGWTSDDSSKAAIWTCGKNPALLQPRSKSSGFVRAEVGGVHVVSCYFAPSLSIEEFTASLARLADEVRGISQMVVAGDFNAWAIDWGCSRTNQRGHILLETFASMDVILLNEGTQHTFSSANGSSAIDLTFVSSGLASQAEWQISRVYTHSDHHAIMFTTANQTRRQRHSGANARATYKVNTLDDSTFETILGNLRPSDSPDDMATYIANSLTRACDAAMLRSRPSRSRHDPVYWWTAEIAETRKAAQIARRRYHRSRSTGGSEELREQLRQLRQSLKRSIKARKRECFMQLCDEADNTPWGMAYKVVMKKLKAFRRPAPTDPQQLEAIVSTLFPRQAVGQPYIIEANPGPQPSDLINIEEFKATAKRIKTSTAPGPDGIPNQALKLAIELQPHAFVEAYNNCLRLGFFPKRWKIQKLVLIPKGPINTGDPAGYRPICLLDETGKLFERFLCTRIEAAIQAGGGFSSHQFGFRKSRSTLDAIRVVTNAAQAAIQGKRWKRGAKQYCLVATLDVRNAFNTANWSRIIEALTGMGVPHYLCKTVCSYFQDRMLIYDTEEGEKSHRITGGVPQGSVLGPLLWNVMYDGVLRLQVPDNVQIVGFADDLAVVVTGKLISDVEVAGSTAIAKIMDWLVSRGLNLAEHKTEAVLISSRKKMETANITVGATDIKTKEHIKYLGVVIDSRLSFKAHLDYTHEKVAKACTALARMMPNRRGPRQARRSLLQNVVRSIILYGSSIWAEALKHQSYRRGIESVYRLGALRVCCAFRTISAEAALVLAGSVPIDLLARESQVPSPAAIPSNINWRKQNRERSMIEWQSRWNSSEKGRWTFQLIPDIVAWCSRKHGALDFYLTQVLSGHGCFRSYLFRFQHTTDPYCAHCVDGSIEDAAHALFVCPRFHQERRETAAVIGEVLTIANMVNHMLECESKWAAVGAFAKHIMEELRRTERLRNSIESRQRGR